MPPSRPIEERFAEKYRVNPKTGCWDWFGSISRGYGYIRGPLGSNRSLLAHKFSYEHHIGKVPKGMIVRHSCDNSLCVNPAHLFPGTHGDNMVDMTRTGRARVLSAKDVGRAIKMIDAGTPQELIGVILGVARSTIERAVSRAKVGDMGPTKVIAKRRQRKKLTDKQREHARSLMAAGEPILRIAALYGVDRKTIRNLREK